MTANWTANYQHFIISFYCSIFEANKKDEYCNKKKQGRYKIHLPCKTYKSFPLH